MLMAISALGKAGIPVVERYETDVAKLEYNLANNKLIAGGPPDGEGRRDYRPILPGQVSGSDFFLTGGVTELNTNLRTTSGTVDWGQGGRKAGNLSAAVYVLNVALDLRLVDTTTLDVVDMISYQKQIIGRQVGGGLFAFFGHNVINVTGGTSGEQPVHLAVRSLVERAVLEFVANLYGAPSLQVCLRAADDPLRPNVVGAEPAAASGGALGR
jgi:curli production assembly/transport component CsgG/holdfast attachment protein HfaB